MQLYYIQDSAKPLYDQILFLSTYLQSPSQIQYWLPDVWLDELLNVGYLIFYSSFFSSAFFLFPCLVRLPCFRLTNSNCRNFWLPRSLNPCNSFMDFGALWHSPVSHIYEDIEHEDILLCLSIVWLSILTLLLRFTFTTQPLAFERNGYSYILTTTLTSIIISLKN